MQAANAASAVHPIRSPLAVIEERTWTRLYQRVHDPAVAEEVVRILDANEDLKHTSTGLYLRAKETLQRQATRQHRLRGVRQALGGIVTLPAIERRTVESAEATLWTCFYRRIRDPILAGEMLIFLDDHPAHKQAHAGPYVHARLTVRYQAARKQRWSGLRNFWRFVVGKPLIPERPPVGNAAEVQVQAPATKPEFARARTVFERRDPVLRPEAFGDGEPVEVSGSHAQAG